MKKEGLITRKNRASDILADKLRRQIESGELKDNDFLLPERQLAEQQGVSSRVVRECLSVLEVEGLIARQQGRGTFVLPKKHENLIPKLKNIAVIFLQRIQDTATVEYFDSLQQAFQREGYGTTIWVTDDSPEKEVKIVERLVQEGVSGIVLFSSHPSGSFAHLQAAQEAGTKVVLFDHCFPGFETNFVGIDDHAGGYGATEHLIRLGCQELLFINWDRDWSTNNLRQQGFEMAASKLSHPAAVLKLPDFESPEAFHADLRKLLPPVLKRSQRRLGIVVWNDIAALQTIDCLRDEGWMVPNDAAVIGFANELDGAMAEIPLTTMAIPREEIARMTAQLMVDQIRDPQRELRQIRFPAHLILRDSCGCYPQLPEFQRTSFSEK